MFSKVAPLSTTVAHGSRRATPTLRYLVILFASCHVLFVARVLELVGEGGAPLGEPISGADSLYEAAAAVPWSRFMEQGQTLSVDAILGVVPEGLTHSHFTALTVKVSIGCVFRQNLCRRVHLSAVFARD